MILLNCELRCVDDASCKETYTSKRFSRINIRFNCLSYAFSSTQRFLYLEYDVEIILNNESKEKKSYIAIYTHALIAIELNAKKRNVE